jgi:putative FmdB family regulatory protein
MPTYEYRCKSCGHEFEEFQSMSADPLTICPKCAKPELKRLMSSGAGLIFKGSGFYLTDYKKANTSSSSNSKSESKPDSKSESKSDAKQESKPESKQESKPDSKSDSQQGSKPSLGSTSSTDPK